MSFVMTVVYFVIGFALGGICWKLGYQQGKDKILSAWSESIADRVKRTNERIAETLRKQREGEQ